LIATIFRLLSVVPPCGVPAGMISIVPGLERNLLVAEPLRPGSGHDDLDLVGVGVVVLGHGPDLHLDRRAVGLERRGGGARRLGQVRDRESCAEGEGRDREGAEGEGPDG
jgi:hypothetical protein